MSDSDHPASGAQAAHVLATRAVEKVWGSTVLPEPFETEVRKVVSPGEPVGEIWFASPAELDQILVKYLFTSDKLSVQVHPSDAQALQGEAGKEECWLILAAERDAKLAIGFREEHSAETIKAAALDGTIEELLAWHEVAAGDFFYLPAGTVHAIGAGISLVEVQQSSDTTFRLYDYGRPRDLHLERAIAVADRGRYSSEHRARVTDATAALVSGPHFQLTRLVGLPDDAVRTQFARPCLVLPLNGGVLHAAGEIPPGSCAYADDLNAFRFSETGVALIVSGAA